MGAMAGKSPRGLEVQLTKEEAMVASEVMMSMFLFIVLSIILWYDYICDSIRYLPSELFACSCVL